MNNFVSIPNKKSIQEVALLRKHLKWREFDFEKSYYDERLFKMIRDNFVDDAINELGVLFFSFELTAKCDNPRDVKFLRSLYETKVPDDQEDIGEGFFHRNLIPWFNAYWKDHASAYPKMSEFIYFVLDKERPAEENIHFDFEWEYYGATARSKLEYYGTFERFKPNYKSSDSDSSDTPVIKLPIRKETEYFTIRGILAVRILVGYEESSALANLLQRKAAVYNNFSYQSADKNSVCSINWTLNHLKSPNQIKSFWDKLVEPASLLAGNAEGLNELTYLHGWHSFRLLEDPQDTFSLKYYKYNGLGFHRLHYYYVSKREEKTLRNGFFFSFITPAYFDEWGIVFRDKNLEINNYADLLGCPAKSSYDSPAILYNLFDIFSKISNIKFYAGSYYMNINGNFLKFLGSELWFKENYFYIKNLLAECFDDFVGLDFYKLFAMQIENVMNIMRIKPLEGSKTQKKLKPNIFWSHEYAKTVIQQSPST